MAEGNALKKQDLFESGLFNEVNAGAEVFLKTFQQVNAEIKSTLTLQKEMKGLNVSVNNSSDIKEANKALDEANKLLKIQAQLEKNAFEVEKQAELLRKTKVQTQREEIKNEQLLSKENAKQQKALSDLNGEYKQGTRNLNEIKKQLKELEFTGRNLSLIHI
jgi:hypothetical protein